MEPEQSTSRRPLIIAVALAVLFALVYITALAVYANSGKSTVEQAPTPQANGIGAQMDVISVDPLRREMTVRLFLEPYGSFEGESGGFKQSMRVKYFLTNGESSTVTQDIAAGDPYALNEVKFLTFGNFDAYPLDRYTQISSSELEDGDDNGQPVPMPIFSVSTLDASGKEIAQEVPLWLGEEIGAPHGWSANWSLSSGDSLMLWNYELKRAGGTLAFVVVVLILMAVLAVAALSVSIRVFRKPGTIEATMASWQAALLFALIPLRNFLPGAPPIGAWIDILVFYWVILALMMSMALFTYTWLRDRGHLPGEKKSKLS